MKKLMLAIGLVAINSSAASMAQGPTLLADTKDWEIYRAGGYHGCLAHHKYNDALSTQDAEGTITISVNHDDQEVVAMITNDGWTLDGVSSIPLRITNERKQSVSLIAKVGDATTLALESPASNVLTLIRNAKVLTLTSNGTTVAQIPMGDAALALTLLGDLCPNPN